MAGGDWSLYYPEIEEFANLYPAVEVAVVQYPKDFSDADAVRAANVLGDTANFDAAIFEAATADADEETPIVELVESDARVPIRTTEEAAGADVFSAEACTVPPGGRRRVSLGFKLTVPKGTYARLAPRSGLALKHSVDIGAGVIDRDCAGICAVVLVNSGQRPFEVRIGDRIAQLVFEKISQALPVIG